MPKVLAPVRPLDEQPDAMTADEAAPYLRQSSRHTRRLIAEGHLDHVVVQIGARRYVSRELLRRFLAGQLDTDPSP